MSSREKIAKSSMSISYMNMPGPGAYQTNFDLLSEHKKGPTFNIRERNNNILDRSVDFPGPTYYPNLSSVKPKSPQHKIGTGP